MRKFGRAAATAAGAASLLSITVLASTYTTSSAAMAAPSAPREGTLAHVKPGGPIALPRNQSSAPRAFSGKTVNVETVEQDGILAACQGTTPVYSAWYEMFPLPPVYSNITVRPGNSIVASAYYKLHRRRGHQLPWAAGRAARSLVGHVRREHGEQQRDGARPAHPDLPWQGVRLLLDGSELTSPGEVSLARQVNLARGRRIENRPVSPW